MIEKAIGLGVIAHSTSTKRLFDMTLSGGKV
jgi:hypothetical protein